MLIQPSHYSPSHYPTVGNDDYWSPSAEAGPHVATTGAASGLETATPTVIGANGAAEGEFGFADFLDIINPLQHIPVISNLYREFTGDEIGPAARVLGGGLFGGAIGLAASMVNMVLEEQTGKDMGEHVMALFQDDPAGNAQPQDGTFPAEGKIQLASLAVPNAASGIESYRKAASLAPPIPASPTPAYFIEPMVDGYP